ncbi:MAG: TIGR01458 family HAD-type hydrolase [Gammaproteobacteria bacterium]
MKSLDKIEGVLFDLDGVLYVGSTPIPGACEAVLAVKRRGIVCRFITNTSTLSRAALHTKLVRLGLPIEADEIVSAARAALLYVETYDDPVCFLALADDVKKDFAHLEQSDEKADFVIVGDIGDAWSYSLLNTIFNLLVRGAKLIAIHKNRFWQTEHGLHMDIGAFVAGLEYASRKPAMIIGKPSADFFRSALLDMGLTAARAAIVGDDIDSDVGGGQNAGLTGILVRTGKYRKTYAEASSVRPDFVIDSVAQLPALLLGTSGNGV